jgi:hypothetical protein
VPVYDRNVTPHLFLGGESNDDFVISGLMPFPASSHYRPML